MARTTESDVNDIFNNDLDSASLSAWIDMASSVVDDIAAKDSSITSTRLTQIEKLLAAHYASAQDQRISNTSRETASVTYQGDTGMNLQGTKYGQQAIQLDPTGTLSTLGKPTASINTPDVKDLGN